MNTDAATRFLDQLINNPELRSQFRDDPEATMIRAGLDEQQRKALAGVDWNSVPDQELAQRVSKNFRIGS
jgi:hypothetical protein